MSQIYKTTSKDHLDGIPVFSSRDGYTENYEAIAKDHLSASAKSRENPFTKEHLWQKIENSTEQLIHKHINPGAKALHVGVGTGKLLGKFKDVDRYGLDISPEYLKIAQQKEIQVCLSKIDLAYQESLALVGMQDLMYISGSLESPAIPLK